MNKLTRVTGFIAFMILTFAHAHFTYSQVCGQGDTKITVGGVIVSSSQTTCPNQQITYGITGTTPLSSPSWCLTPTTAGTFVNGVTSGISVSVIWLTTGTLELDYPNRSGSQCETVYYTIASNPGTISGPATSCYGGSGSFTISGNSSAVTWQQCSSGCSTTNDTGWTSTTNSFSNLVINTSFRAKLTDTSCGVKYSNMITTSVYPQFNAGSISQPGSVYCAGQSIALSSTAGASGGNGVISYQWQYNTGSGFVNLTGPGVDQTAYTIPTGQIPAGSTYTYQRLAKDNVCQVAWVASNSLSVSVSASLNGGSLPPSSSICTGTSPGLITGSAPLDGGGAYQYAWQKSADGATWSVNITGATASSYDPPETITTRTYYRRVVTSLCGSQSSFTYVDVYSTAAGSITGTASVCAGAGGSFTLGGNSGAVTWQRCPSGCSTTSDTGWTTNATGNTFTNLTVTTQFRAKLNDISCGVKYTNMITVLVTPLPSVSITGNTTFCAGSSTLLTATSSMDSYQWYKGGVIISGATTSTYSVNQAGTYTVVVSKNGCSTTSAGVVVSSLALPVATITPTGNIKIASTATQNIVASTGTGYTYRWLKDGSVITGATSSSYAATLAGTYNVEATQNGCINNSSLLTLTKNSIPQVSAGQDQVLNYKAGMLVTINGSATDSDGTISSYQWSKVSGPSVTLSGATTATLVVSNIIVGSYGFKLTATDNFGESSTSNIISIVITQLPNNYNYVSSSTILVPGISNPASIDALTVDQKSQTYQYVDGLGRAMQTVTMQGSPSRLDMVQPVVYDQYGREHKKYLPFTAQNNGWHKPTDEIIDKVTGNYIGIAQLFYNTPNDAIADDSRPYSETLFEETPLNRPDKDIGAGSLWLTNSRFIQHGYTINSHGTLSGQEKIIAWSINSNKLPVRSALKTGYIETGGYYSTGLLTIKSTKDEEGYEVREYTDKLGRVILKKVQAVANAVLNNRDHWAQTYYIYDDIGNLRFVLPPELSYLIHQNEVYNPTVLDMDNWAFRYTYDSRKRMITKQVPGAGRMYMVYDNRDRLILTQDSVQRTTSPYRWTFTKYDVLNRPILTGVKDTIANLTQSQMQGAVDSHFAKVSSRWGETFVANQAGNVHGYSNKAYPVRTGDASEINNNKYLTVTYYDNYDFRSLWTGDYDYVNDSLSKTVNSVPFSQPLSWNKRIVGQVTGSKVKVLDGGTVGGYTWLKSITYYDDRYRNIQTISDNYKGSVDRLSTLYDFAGKVLKTKSCHTEGDVVWKDRVNVTLRGNQLISTTTSAGAASVEQLAAGKTGWLEVIYSEGNTTRFIGLNDANPDVLSSNINYAFRFTATNTVNVYESNTLKATITGVNPGDVFRMKRTGGVVTYTRNGIAIALSPASTPSTTLLMVDASFTTSGATLTDVRTSFSAKSKTVLQSFDYDHAGRLLKTWHQVDANPELLLVLNQYNEAGQLVDKKLHSTIANGSNAKQSVDYRYNIRGWLTKINESDINVGFNDASNSGEARDLFGMVLAYNTVIPGISTSAGLFNGNISSVAWSNHLGLGMFKENGFVYSYDPMSRLKSGIYKIDSVNNWLPRSYEEVISAYDLNGNIKGLTRKGGGNAVIDNLTYSYTGNRLTQVSDAADKTKGFIDGASAGTDYVYDANGNLIWDRNKGGAETLLNPSFENGSANWTIADSKLRLTFANNEVQVKTGTSTATLTQAGIVKSKPYVIEVDVERTAGSLTVNVGGTVLTLSTTGVQSFSINAGTANNNLVVTAATTFAGKIKRISVKGVTVITYNYLNLPEVVTRAGDKQIQYIYDASGRKLAQELSKNALLEKRTDYAGDFFYENDTLKFINHAEGRIIMTGSTPEYQYHLKDHLGNVRLTFTSKDEVESSMATLETAAANTEQGQFLNYTEAIKINTTIFDHTDAGTTYYSTRLTGGTTDAIIGLAKSLSVMPGDKIDIEVYAKYLDPVKANWTAAMATFMAAIGGGTAPTGTVIDGGLPGSIGSGTFPFGGYLSHTGETGTNPKAYLNYLVFDRDYVYKTGGFKRISIGARETGTDIKHEKLAFDGANQVLITEPGYVYIWLSNENETAVEVYFDDFKVTHTKSPVIQEDDYYPFGLTFNSYQREESLINRIKFQGQEHINDLGLNWDSFKWRNHQPDIGRFFNIDPIAEKYYYNSPYAFAENRVVDGRELEGLEWQPVNDKWENVKEGSDNIYSYTWVGFNEDGTAPKGTVGEALIKNANNTGATFWGVNAETKGPMTEFSKVKERTVNYDGTMEAFPDDVSKEWASGELTISTTYNNGKTVNEEGTWTAISGPWGNGALENGSYNSNNLRDNRIGSYENNGVGYTFDINPNFNTGRTELRFHPDGGTQGTAGCIGLNGDSTALANFRSRMSSMLSNLSSVRVNVNITNNPNNNGRKKN